MSVVASRPRTTWQLLLDRRFGPFIAGKLLAFTGIWVHNVVASVLVWRMTGSASWIAVVSIVQFGPQLLLTPISGAIADRGRHAVQVVVGRVVCTIGTAGLAAVLWWRGEDATPLWCVLAGSFVLGCGFALGGPAMQSMVPDLVRPEEIRQAVAIDGTPLMLSRAIGPALGAMLAATIGIPGAFAVGAIGHVVLGIVAACLARGEVRKLPSPGGTRFRDGLRYLGTERRVVLLLVGVTAVGLGADPVVTLAPPLADQWGGSTTLVGYFGTAFGIGAVVGSIMASVSARLLPEAMVPTLGLTILAAGLLGVAASTSAPMACASFALAGLGFTIALSGCTALVYAVVPAEFRGRVMSVWLIGFMGSRPFAAAYNGFIADLAGVRWAVAATALLVCIAVGCCLPMFVRPSARP